MAQKTRKRRRKISKNKVAKPKKNRKNLVKRAKKKAKKTQKLAVKKAAPVKAITKKVLGEIIHFYPNISVGVVKIKSELKLGDAIVIAGHGRSFEQKVTSLQIEHQPLSMVKKGQIIGMKVVRPVKEKDLVYKKSTQR